MFYTYFRVHNNFSGIIFCDINDGLWLSIDLLFTNNQFYFVGFLALRAASARAKQYYSFKSLARKSTAKLQNEDVTTEEQSKDS